VRILPRYAPLGASILPEMICDRQRNSIAMKQLLLDIAPPPAPESDNFVLGRNSD
jgi:hypothetical protein